MGTTSSGGSSTKEFVALSTASLAMGVADARFPEISGEEFKIDEQTAETITREISYVGSAAPSEDLVTTQYGSYRILNWSSFEEDNNEVYDKNQALSLVTTNNNDDTSDQEVRSINEQIVQCYETLDDMLMYDADEAETQKLYQELDELQTEEVRLLRERIRPQMEVLKEGVDIIKEFLPT